MPEKKTATEMSTEGQEQKTTTSGNENSSQQQEASSVTTPATSALKNSVKRVSIKGTPSRVKIAAPYAYVEVIGLVLLLVFWHVHAALRSELK